MRKILLIAVLIIILVSISWFQEVLATDFDNVSDSQKRALLEKYQKNTRVDNETFYQTPQLFENIPDGDSLEADTNALPEEPEDSDTTIAIESQAVPWTELKPYGMDLFANNRSTASLGDIASDDAYILGPGDNIIIYLWGRVEKQFNLTVDREGMVFIPQVGSVAAWGKRLSDFRKQIRNKLTEVYSEFELNISLGRIRSIRIYVTGEIHSPGAYTVSSITSLFNALFIAGGPTENGSMRSIRLMRGGKKIAEVDLYKFLLNGDNSLDVRLQSGDAVFVPISSKRVAIRGEIRRPAIYEMAPGESIGDLVRLAGGTTPEAHMERVMLERIGDQSEWEVRDVNLKGNIGNNDYKLSLSDGDRVTVYSIFEAKNNLVAVFGKVKHPGYYERTDSTTLSDLLARAELQPYDVYLDRANLFRRYSDWRVEVIPVNLKALVDGKIEDFVLSDHDSLHVYSIEEVSWKRTVEIHGEVNKPGEYPYYDNMSVSDLIFLAGSYTRAAWKMQAEIARVDSLGNVAVQPIEIGNRSDKKILLTENDRVYIRQIPQWRRHRTVTLEGEVRYPGEYVLRSAEETLYSLLVRAGGFTEKAFPIGTIFKRESISRSIDRLQLRERVQNENGYKTDSLGNIITGEVLELNTESVNRIVIDVPELYRTDGAYGDIALEPGDQIRVPSIPSGISVLGAVGHTGTIQYRNNKKAKYYIKRAGDFSKQAKKNAIRLVRANGEVFSGGSVLGKRVDIGDVIVVPTKVEKERNMGRSLASILSITTGALTTILLVTKL